MDNTPPSLQLRRHLLAEGCTDSQLLRPRRSGELRTIRDGAYVAADDARHRFPEVEHLLLVRSTLPRLASGAVVSHVSAAVLHNLPIWNVPTDRVHVTRDARAGGRISARLHLHVSPLEPDDVVDVDGVLVTSKARTIVDTAVSLPFEQAVVVADGGLADPLVGPALVAAMERAAGRTAIERARRVVAFADGRSGSVGETRVAMMRAGLPAPVLQWDVHSAGGLWIGCVDFGWPTLRTVAEFDGRIKYGRLLRPGQDPGEVVFAEKVREDAIRDVELGVVRWVWSDLKNFAPVADRLRRSYQRRSRA